MLVLDNCVIFDGVSAELAQNMAIVIEDGVIREISRAGSAPSGAEVRDMGGRFVMPGLIDAHFHSYWYQWNSNAIDATKPQLRSLHAAKLLEQALRRGFTTIRDAGGGDVSLARGIQLGLIDGPRFFYPGYALGQTGGHVDPRAPEYHDDGYYEGRCACPVCTSFVKLVDGPDEMRKAVRENLRTGATQIKIHTSGSPTESATDPIWYTQLQDEEIAVAVQEATARRVYVMAHAHSNEAALRCLKNGVRSIEHVSALEEDGARMIAEKEAFAVPTLAALDMIANAAPPGFPEVWIEGGRKMGKRALQSLQYLRDAGAQMGFGTDLCGAVGERQLREFGLRAQVLSPIEVLRSATSINAKLVKMEGKIGTVAEGAFADLLAIDGNPLEDIAVMEQQEKHHMIMRNGQFIKWTIN